MPRDQSEGFVLRTLPIGDQDKLVVFFSRDKGILRGVAKGARKFGNRFGSCLEPLSLTKFYYYEKESRDLVTISGCDLLESFFEIQATVEAACTLGYFAELIEAFHPARSEEALLFRLLLSTLQALKGGGDLEFNAAYFEAWFLKINGLLPDLGRCRKCGHPIEGQSSLSPGKEGILCGRCFPSPEEPLSGAIRSFMDWIKKNPPSPQTAPPVPADEVTRIRNTLQSLIVYHMEREPQSLRYISLNLKEAKS